MNILKNLKQRWPFILAGLLIVVGITLNLYAASHFLKPNTNPLPPPPPPTAIQPPNPPETLPPQTEPKYGHFPYPEANQNNLIIISSYAQKQYQRFEKMHTEAALALMKMIYAARDEGVWIVPVSGFRTIAYQETLFQAQIQRRGSPEEAAKLSAPAGYSEHHTGYAIDLADGNFPKQDITYEFANTNAFRWLNKHAKEYGFELSFPENNPQGISYEPWHWRFIASPSAAKIFAGAKNP
ncbi:M15 family metallopeptidase [Ancylothrix sp. C2]|uniref:M15 family metallopeptidase n=1 Tax=Ancylothrix sp. D3o TaxID=2953691 RepID=UPI0021BADCE3|nr:M15 family metallopeptidase [Ancylothrix sp. D3o]MCT7951568.1 M15 family metallopeptidase [Ancylothrix sp. D3o]